MRATRLNVEVSEGATSRFSFDFTGESLVGAQAAFTVIDKANAQVYFAASSYGSPGLEMIVTGTTVSMSLSPDTTVLLASTVRASGPLRYQLDMQLSGDDGIRRYIGEVNVVPGLRAIGEDSQLDFSDASNSQLMLGGWI